MTGPAKLLFVLFVLVAALGMVLLVAAVGIAWRRADRLQRPAIANKYALRAGPLHLYEARP